MADHPPAALSEAIDELRAAVRHTAAAVHTILDACERLDAAFAGKPGGWQAELTCIYEAGAFQDIVGQRLHKVVRILQKPEHAASAPGEATLLAGPQARLHGLSQRAVDTLLEQRT